MMFIGIDDLLVAAPPAAAVTTCLHCWRPFHGREMSGGKGAKGGNLESLGNRSPAGAVATRRKPAETGGNCHKPAGTPWRGTSRVAENAENKFYCADAALRLHRMRNIISCGRGEPDSLTGDGQNGERGIAEIGVSPEGRALRFVVPNSRSSLMCLQCWPYPPGSGRTEECRE